MAPRRVAIALALLGLALAGVGIARAANPAGSEQARLLRLHDLPLGYLGVAAVENRYESLAGMEAVVGALRARP